VVIPDVAATLTVAGFPSPVTAGTVGSFTVTARDAYGNFATGYTGTVHFTSTDGQANLPGDYTFTADDGGVHTFTATLKTAGTQSIRATDDGGLTAEQSGIMVNPAAAASFLVAGYPSPVLVNTVNTFTVTALDPYGNVATGYTGTVHFTSSDSAANLPEDYTFTATDKGMQTFAAIFETVGTQSLTATDKVDSSITGTQSAIEVVASVGPDGFQQHGPALAPATAQLTSQTVATSGPATRLAPAATPEAAAPNQAVPSSEGLRPGWVDQTQADALDQLFADFIRGDFAQDFARDAILTGAG
jgi:hypothetical protein